MTKDESNHVSFTLEWFKRNSGIKFTNEELKTLLPIAFFSTTGFRMADPTRAARALVKQGVVKRTPKGVDQVFWYEPGVINQAERFDDNEKVAILERDGFRCVVCKKGVDDGVKVSVGYAKSLQRGGTLNIENGRTLCEIHLWIIQTAQESEEGKKNWRRLAIQLPKIGDSKRAIKFWEEFMALLIRYEIDVTK
jgi:hypothetical protein